MKNLSLVQLVKQHLDAARFNTSDYNSITNFLKANFTNQEVFSTMRYVKGEYTEAQEEIYLELHS